LVFLTLSLAWILQELQERMPSDPFEAELLMMAEAVASGGARGSDNDSDGSDDEPDHCKHVDVSVLLFIVKAVLIFSMSHIPLVIVSQNLWESELDESCKKTVWVPSLPFSHYL
jgi:hypothetical protein